MKAGSGGHGATTIVTRLMTITIAVATPVARSTSR
eukprot:CAMPEP_0114442378 /NCGR_PEP_ID=MMETSP0103-20121206/16914_1 /TAXON_ID=37642 ORGANISM="Paraphysomonas imperforata, Strain PA2" /NCGR_SAMPLE_ID=MMETSP0103 /ASSEMBLY_ACC=CAM_ASM_000201 /LENGTH=34 /DNA_ID= /DNA_START= /DNA_END= /DNA_ORIENTATION=